MYVTTVHIVFQSVHSNYNASWHMRIAVYDSLFVNVCVGVCVLLL